MIDRLKRFLKRPAAPAPAPVQPPINSVARALRARREARAAGLVGGNGSAVISLDDAGRVAGVAHEATGFSPVDLESAQPRNRTHLYWP